MFQEGNSIANPVILHNQYHGCWWPGDARRQGISSHSADLILLKNVIFWFQHLKV